MADPKNKNVQKKEGKETISVLDKKRHYLLDELSELMDQASGNYGPFLMEELQQRLASVVKNFNEELKDLIKCSFKEWENKDSQIRDLMATNIDNIQIQTNQPEKEKAEDSSTPDFIKDVEFGPIRRK